MFLGNEIILALINAYKRTGYPNTLKPLIDRIFALLPSNPTLLELDHSDALVGAIVPKIVTHEADHAVVSHGRHHLHHIELVMYLAGECNAQNLCLLTR